MKPLPDLSGRVALRPQEAARAVGVSLNTLLSWRGKGLPSVTIGRCLLVPVADLRKWLSSQVGRAAHQPQDDFDQHGPGAMEDNSDAH